MDDAAPFWKSTKPLPLKPVEVPPLAHLRLFERVRGLFARLSDAGTQRDTAGNRQFLYSHYASLVLLGVLNPSVQALRGLQQASTLRAVQKRLGVKRVSLGSLSESCRVFDPELLVPIVQELLEQLPAGQAAPGPRREISPIIPEELAARLVAVDASTLEALPQLFQGMLEQRWKLHLEFCPLTGGSWSPAVLPEKAWDERDVLLSRLRKGCVYLADRGYERYGLYNAIVRAGSDYLIRGQARPMVVVEERPLSDAARAARVLRDEIVQTKPQRPKRGVEYVDHPLRRIVIAGAQGAGAQGRPRADRPRTEEVILYTNLLEVPAEVLAAIYTLRWSIELFFRFLKHLLGCERLLSGKTEGVAIQVYCALIAALLLAQVTQGRVTMSNFRLITLYLQGWAQEDELLAGLRLPAKEP
jgi:hypothetical protein